MTVPIGTVYQTAFVVPNLQDAIGEWAAKMKAGPWMVFDPFGFTDKNGNPYDVDISIALAFSGDHFLELIQVNSDAPSIFAEVNKRGGGFHHIAKLTTDPEADIAEANSNGLDLAFRGYFGGTSSCSFIDCRQMFGGYLEFVHSNDGLQGMLGFAKQAHDTWDGKDLILDLPEG